MCTMRRTKIISNKKIYNSQPKNNKTIFTYNYALCNPQTIKLFFFLSLLFFSLTYFSPPYTCPPISLFFFPAFPPHHMTTHVHHIFFFFPSFFLRLTVSLSLFPFSPSPFFHRSSLPFLYS